MLIHCVMSQLVVAEVSANCYHVLAGFLQNRDWCCQSHQLQLEKKNNNKNNPDSVSSRVLLPIKATCLLPLMTH